MVHVALPACPHLLLELDLAHGVWGMLLVASLTTGGRRRGVSSVIWGV
jgi:hypothetical protein